SAVLTAILSANHVSLGQTPAGLEVGFDDRGLASVRWGGAEILHAGPMELPHFDLRHGFPPAPVRPVAADPQVTFDPAARRTLQTYPWGTLGCAYRVDGYRLML